MNINSELFDEVNDLKEQDIDLNIDIVDLPFFMQNVIQFSVLSNEGALKFMRKFGSYYLEIELFRKLTDGCVFIIINEDYIGAYRSKDAAILAANSMGYERRDVFVYPMYLRRIEENNERILLSSVNSTILKPHANGEIMKKEFHSHFYVDIAFSENPYETIKYMVDLGCTITHAPFVNYITTKYRYGKHPFNKDGSQDLDDDVKKEWLIDINNFIIDTS